MTETSSDRVAQHGLTPEEYERIGKILGRQPNGVELGIFSVMWSEHCSYKSSKKWLARLPAEAPWVICGPGENAGIVDIGDGQAAVFKIESHNHPSFIEPYQGAATGVGGILRDVFTMGARPIANLNALRFGDPDHAKTRHLVAGVVAGIGGYGNCVGVPTVGGECTFDQSFNGNILVNAMTVGLVDTDRIFYSTAAGIDNPVIYVGSKTGRDGIHGATMASAEFDDASEDKRPTVQVGDPFTEKLLIEACLELMAADVIVGIQDMGAAGLTSSSFEMASKGGVGIALDLDAVPTREVGMTAYEIMLSESQERMLMVLKQGEEETARAIFAKWELDFAVIGEVTDTGHMVLRHGGETVADLPIAPVVAEAPVYDRPWVAPPAPMPVNPHADASDETARAIFAKWELDFAVIGEVTDTGHMVLRHGGETVADLPIAPVVAEAPVYDRPWVAPPAPMPVNPHADASDESPVDVLRRLLASPDLASKRWVWEQYDHMVMTDTVQRPGGDAAVVRVHGTNKGLAIATDCTPRYCAADAAMGARQAVAECWRNLTATGARPLAITDCLNFGSPERAEVMGQFVGAIEGIAEACRALDFPVVSGNVSFYNETNGQAIQPTPEIGGVGLIDDLGCMARHAFAAPDEAILLVGNTSGHLGASLYLREITGATDGPPPPVDFAAERRHGDFVRGLITATRITACHDVSDGGLLVALSEMALAGGIGATLSLGEDNATRPAFLFGEDQGRYLVTAPDAESGRIEAEAIAARIPLAMIGRTGGMDLTVGRGYTISLSELRAAHEMWLPGYMAGAAA